jgi:hypothetical protein
MSRKRSQILRDFLAHHPTCIFCGGNTPATTQDHVPSRQTFHNRAWPEGYEFPSCESCNKATRHEEQVIAMFSRLYPEGKTDAEKKEMVAIINAVRRNYPSVIRELQPSPDQIERYRSRPWSGAWVLPVSLNGPLINGCARVVARKLFSALHYKEFHKIIPPQGGIVWRWFSNADLLDNKLPDELISMMSKAPVIQRTRRDLSDQFTYTFVKVVDGELTAYFATFRQSFAMLGFVEMDSSLFGVDDQSRILRPLQP